ncbi:MAG TPA: ComF family protein [Actinotalea sp.]|nr:ComF family protein [Actinotalea sp.]
MDLRLLDQLLGLVLPLSCAGCGAPDERWCPRCAPALDRAARRESGCPRLHRLDGGPPLPVWTAGWYAGPVRSAVLSWKDGGRGELTAVMTAAARTAAAAARPQLAAAVAAAGGPLRVVGVPARARAARRRGADLVGRLADSVTGELVDLGARRERVLARRGGASLHALSPAQRSRTDPGYLVSAAVVRGGGYLLVDDVVTTGATFARCADALAGSGALVLGAIAVAATPGFTRSALLPGGEGG